MTKSFFQRSAEEGGIFILRLRLSAIVVTVIVFTLMLIWAFVLGIMTGRGYKAEQQIGGIAEYIAPTPKDKPAAGSGVIVGEKPISMEELNFKETLTERNTQRPEATPPARSGQPAQSQQPQQPQQTAAAKTETFDYVMQVASFSQKSQANKLVTTLKGQKMKGTVESFKAGNATKYRVVVAFRGSENDLEANKAKLKKLKLGNPLIRKKTPVSR